MAEKVKVKGKKGIEENHFLNETTPENHTFGSKGEKGRRIQKFISLYPKKNTKGVYQSAVFSFLDCIFGVEVRKTKFYLTDEERVKYEELADRYFSEERNYFEDLLSFSASMNGRAPLGARSMISGVREFLSYSGVEFTTNQLKSLSKKLPKGTMERTAEKDIEVETLRKMLTHADLKTKAVILTLASSGMRIGEALQIKLSDIDLDKTPPQIIVRGEYTKSGDTRITFISQEAREILTEWLRVRDRYIESAKNKSVGLVKKMGISNNKAVSDCLFPFTDINFRTSWDNTLKKAGLYSQDKSTNFSQIRVHGLRKFFRSQLALSCPHDIVEALMGHEEYLTDAYRRYSQKQLGEYYLKGEHHVTIMRSGNIGEIQDKLQDQQATINGYRGIISKQEEEISELGAMINDINERLMVEEHFHNQTQDDVGRLERALNYYDAILHLEEAAKERGKELTPEQKAIAFDHLMGLYKERKK